MSSGCWVRSIAFDYFFSDFDFPESPSRAFHVDCDFVVGVMLSQLFYLVRRGGIDFRHYEPQCYLPCVKCPALLFTHYDDGEFICTI